MAPPTSSPSSRARLPGVLLTRPTSPQRMIPPSQPTISGSPTSSPSSSCLPKLPTPPGRDILRTISSHKSLVEQQQTRTRPTTGQPSVAPTGQPRPGWEGNREKGTPDPRLSLRTLWTSEFEGNTTDITRSLLSGRESTSSLSSAPWPSPTGSSTTSL